MKRIIFINALILFLFLFATAQETELRQGKTITIETSMGNLRVLLYDETPLHQENMLELIREG